jgi:hypothetical protein
MKTKAPHHFFSLRIFVGLLIVLTEIVFLHYLAAAGVEVVLSSLVVTIALLIQLRFAVRADVVTPADIAVFIFNWLFLDLAPKIQLIGAPQQLVNTSSVDVGGLAMTNLMCALFMITFTLVRLSEQAGEGLGKAEVRGKSAGCSGLGGRLRGRTRGTCRTCRTANSVHGSSRRGGNWHLRFDGGCGGALCV